MINEVPIIGVSPGNSFFTDNEIENLLENIFSKYNHAVVFIPDIPAQNTYKALGYDEKSAKRKALLKGNNLRNKFQRISDRIGIQRETLEFVDWKKIEKNKYYITAYSEIKKLYKTNNTFKESAQDTTYKVLQNHEKKNWSAKEIEIGVEYLLCELAYMQSAPKILNTKKATYIYNKEWPVYEKLISGIFDKKERIDQHFWLIESKKNTFSPITYRSAWERIQKTKIIRAGYFPCLNRFIENKSGLAGFMYDVFTKIAEKEGWIIDWVEKTGYGVVSNRLNEKVYDIFCSTVWPTPEREVFISFTESMFTVPCYLWKKPETKKIKSVSVKYGDVHDSYVEKIPYEIRKVYVPQFSDVLSPIRFVDEGSADATFAEPDHIKSYLIENPKANFIQEKNILIPCTNSFVVANEEIELLKCLNKHILKMKKSGFIKKLIKKYKVSCL